MSAPTRLATLDPDRVRAGLESADLASPFAFVPDIDAAYDARVHREALARELPEEDDLRIAYGEGPEERWVLAQRLPWDSDFFGRGIARLDAIASPSGPVGLRADVAAEAAALGAALAHAKDRGVSYVFAVVEARDLPTLRAVQSRGFELIETRMTFEMPLVPAVERFDTRLATEADVPSLARAARESVNPFDRFHADPAIAGADADRLMEEWVRASIATPFADATIVPAVEAPDAFCTAKLHREHWDGWGVRIGQPVLGAVAPGRFRGWYRKLISEAHEYLRIEGADHTFMVTQVTNTAAVRSFERVGYRYARGEHVFRRLL